MRAASGMALGTVAAATAAPAQALAAVAIAAAAAGADPLPWCVAVVVLSAVRAALSYAAARRVAAEAGIAELALLCRHGASAAAAGIAAWRRIGEIVTARSEWRRSAAEGGGLMLGCIAVLAWVDPLLAIVWSLLSLVLAWAAMSGRWADDDAQRQHASRLRCEGVRNAWRPSAAWLAAIGVASWAADAAGRQTEAAEARLHADGDRQRRRQMLVLMAAGLIQTGAAAWAVLLAAGGSIATGAAVAAILATTTVASRSELAVHLAALQARRRRAEAALADGTGATRAVAAAGVAIVVPDPALPTTTVARHLDPAGDRRPGDLADALARVGLDAGHLAADPSRLSAGERVRLEAARALLAGPRLLLLIDPARHLGAAAAARFIAAIRDSAGPAEVVVAGGGEDGPVAAGATPAYAGRTAA